MLLRSRTVLPLAAPPLDDGGILIEGDRIRAVGRWPELSRRHFGDQLDLGEVVLLPGLINAHCHLDYTNMAGQLRPERHFSDWIKSIVALKASWGYTDFARSWLDGSKMLLQSGTTTVVDIEAVPELLPDVLESTALRVLSCLELISVRSRASAEEVISEITQRLDPFLDYCAGLSPHAPYSTSPGLLRAAAATARELNWLLTTHVSESADEFAMFVSQGGAMHDWLRPQRDLSDCDGRSPIQHLARCGALGPHQLAVHANYLARGDAELLATSGTSVVHCPRSHLYFGHEPFPFEDLTHSGVNICLGTDSMATMAKVRGEPLALNLLSEMRTFAQAHPAVSPQRLVEMATVHAARAIRQAGQLGVLTPGASADLIALPQPASGADVFESVVEHRGDVLASMIRGRWAIAPSHIGARA